MSSPLRRSPRLAAKAVAGKIRVPNGTLKHYIKTISGLSLHAFDAEAVIQEILDDIEIYISDNQVCNAYILLLAAQEFAKQIDEDHIEGISSSNALQVKMYNYSLKAYGILADRFVD